MSKLFNFIDTESQRNCAGELRAEDLPAHEHQASEISVNTDDFNKNLSSEEDTVQKALDKLDDLDMGGGLPSGDKELQTLHYKGNQWRTNKSLLINNSAPYYIMPNYDEYFRGTEVHIVCPREVSTFNERAISFSANPNGMSIDTSIMGNQLAGYKFQLGLSMPYRTSPTTYLTYLNLEGSNTKISLKTNDRNTQPIVFEINNNKLTLSKDGVIKSASLAGEGEALLKALPDGTIVRALQGPIT